MFLNMWTTLYFRTFFISVVDSKKQTFQQQKFGRKEIFISVTENMR